MTLTDTIKTLPGYDPYQQAGDCVFDEASANRAIGFFSECLQHIEGQFAGKPFELSPWELATTANLFGWKRPDGTRRYREVFIMVPRGSGKSPYAAGLGNYLLFCDGEVGAQIYCAAADREQASLVFRHAKGMVEAEPELDSRANVFKGVGHRSIALKSDGASVFRVLSSDAETKHGFTPHAVICDEVHAWPKRDLMDVFQTAFSKITRRQPLFILITTADYEREGSICNEKQDYAERVCRNEIHDPSFLPVVYKADLEDDWQKESTWEKANPNIDITVSREQLRRECERAKASPSYLNEFLRLHLNVRTKTETRFIDISRWDALKSADDNMPDSACYVGMDLSTTTDITSIALVWPDEDRGYLVRSESWIPENNIRKRERRDRSIPYSAWARAGWLHTTPGDIVDYGHIFERIKALADTYRIAKIAFDPWNATALATQLQAAGMKMEQHRQGFASMSAPTKELEKAILGGKIRHDGNPLLRWAISNLVTEQDAAGNIKPSKAKSNERIDPAVALIMAISASMTEARHTSVYESRGLLRV